MTVKIYLFTILTIFVVCEAKKVNFIPPNSHILKLVLKFNEDRIDDFVIDSFFATNNPESNKIIHCQVTLDDIIKALPIKKLSIKDFIEAVSKLNVSITDDDINNFINSLNYKDFKSTGITVQKVYKNLVKTFKGNPLQLQQVLNTLDVTSEFATAYTFGTDEDLFKAIQNVNITYSKLIEVADIVGGTTVVKDLVNILGLKKLDETILPNFINNKIAPLLFQAGLTEENFKSFLQTLGLSISNYKNSKSFKNCYSSLTKSKSLAVAVSSNELVTNDDSLIAKYVTLEPYTTLIAESVEKSNAEYIISADNINANTTENVIRIKVNGILPLYVDEANNYKDLQNQVCYYITIDEDDELITQVTTPTLVDEQLTVIKSYNSLFKKSSPLICGQYLYGLAAVNRLNAIIFDYFEDKNVEEKEEDIKQILENPKVIKAIKEFFGKIVENFDPCNYLNCGNVEENISPNGTNEKEDTIENQDESTNEEKANSNETAVDDNANQSTESDETKQITSEKPQEEDQEENSNANNENQQDQISDQISTENQTSVADESNNINEENSEISNEQVSKNDQEEQTKQPEESSPIEEEEKPVIEADNNLENSEDTQNDISAINPETGTTINTVEIVTEENFAEGVSEDTITVDVTEESEEAEIVNTITEVVTNGSTSL